MLFEFTGIENAVYNAIKDDVQKIIDQERKNALEVNQRAVVALFRRGTDKELIAEELDIPIEQVIEILNKKNSD